MCPLLHDLLEGKRKRKNEQMINNLKNKKREEKEKRASKKRKLVSNVTSWKFLSGIFGNDVI